MQNNWKDIPKWEGIYQINTDGVVKRIGGRVRRRGCKDGVLKPKPHTAGYRVVALQEKPRREYWLVHRLVMFVFIGAALPGIEVNHINGDKTDNRLENLEYVTSSQNKIHASRVLGSNTGEKNGNSKLSSRDVEEIKTRIRNGELGYKLAEEYGMSRTQISRIKTGKRWFHD